MKISVIGAGLIGRSHVDYVVRSSEASLANIVDPTPQSKALACSLGVPHFTSVEEMLEAELPDGVIIATPNGLHLEHGLASINAGIPALVEKPIADTIASAQDLVAASHHKKVPLLIGHHRRHNPILQEAKTKIESGSIGRLVAAHTTCWLPKPDFYFDVAWRTKAGAGPIYINLIHDIDTLRFLLGDVVEVQAMTSNVQRGFDVEDTAVILLRFETGALGTVTLSDAIVSPHSWELAAAENSAYPFCGQTSTLIGGTRGTLEIPNGRVWTQEEPNWWEPLHEVQYPTEEANAFERQLTHFCAVIAGKEQPLVSGEEGLKTLSVIEEIARACP